MKEYVLPAVMKALDRVPEGDPEREDLEKLHEKIVRNEKEREKEEEARELGKKLQEHFSIYTADTPITEAIPMDRDDEFYPDFENMMGSLTDKEKRKTRRVMNVVLRESMLIERKLSEVNEPNESLLPPLKVLGDISGYDFNEAFTPGLGKTGVLVIEEAFPGDPEED